MSDHHSGRPDRRTNYCRPHRSPGDAILLARPALISRISNTGAASASPLPVGPVRRSPGRNRPVSQIDINLFCSSCSGTTQISLSRFERRPAPRLYQRVPSRNGDDSRVQRRRLRHGHLRRAPDPHSWDTLRDHLQGRLQSFRRDIRLRVQLRFRISAISSQLQSVYQRPARHVHEQRLDLDSGYHLRR